MNKKILITILVAVLVLIGIYFYYNYNTDMVPNVYNAPVSNSNIQNIPPAQKKPSTLKSKSAVNPNPVSKTYVVNLKDSGIDPRSINILKGDTVKFINDGTRPFWVASDPHPIHNLCPGFDSSHGLVHGESWSYTFKFDAPKTCTYHNHVDATTVIYQGSINIVK